MPRLTPFDLDVADTDQCTPGNPWAGSGPIIFDPVWISEVSICLTVVFNNFLGTETDVLFLVQGTTAGFIVVQ